MEPEQEWKKGWLEIRNDTYPKVTQEVGFRIISPSRVYPTVDGPFYSRTGMETPSLAAMMAKILHVGVPELSSGDLRLGTQERLGKGQCLEIEVPVAPYDCRLRFLAEVLNVEEAEEMKESLSSGGLHVTAVHRLDLDKFNTAVESRKARR